MASTVPQWCGAPSGDTMSRRVDEQKVNSADYNAHFPAAVASLCTPRLRLYLGEKATMAIHETLKIQAVARLESFPLVLQDSLETSINNSMHVPLNNCESPDTYKHTHTHTNTQHEN